MPLGQTLKGGEGVLVRNASVAATELIREAIVDGRLLSGQRLHEEELARELVRENFFFHETISRAQAARGSRRWSAR